MCSYKRVSATLISAAAAISFSGSARAVDGVIEINQAKALAGSVTPGDTPGFPILIFESGSYRLTGDLEVTGANVTAITVQTNEFVTIDLNGFSLIGPTTCSGNPFPCSPTGTGIGIAGRRGKIINGAVTGFGGGGILSARHVEGVTVQSNGADGIASADIVIHNIVNRNGGNGIVAGSIVTGNVVINNGLDGIVCFVGCVATGNLVITSFAPVDGIDVGNNGTVRGNSVSANGGGAALRLFPRTGYADNVIETFGATATVVGGVEMGTNVCNGNTTCP